MIALSVNLNKIALIRNSRDTTNPDIPQHAQMCIARAVEFRRFLVRSANSGVSMVVTPTGEISHAIELNQTAVMTVDVLKLSGLTFSARHGDAPLLIACALLVLAAWLVSRRVPVR